MKLLQDMQQFAAADTFDDLSDLYSDPARLAEAAVSGAAPATAACLCFYRGQGFLAGVSCIVSCCSDGLARGTVAGLEKPLTPRGVQAGPWLCRP